MAQVLFFSNRVSNFEIKWPSVKLEKKGISKRFNFVFRRDCFSSKIPEAIICISLLQCGAVFETLKFLRVILENIPMSTFVCSNWFLYREQCRSLVQAVI